LRESKRERNFAKRLTGPDAQLPATTGSAEGSLSFDSHLVGAAGPHSNRSSAAFDAQQPSRIEQEGFERWTGLSKAGGLKRQRAFFEVGKEMPVQQVSSEAPLSKLARHEYSQPVILSNSNSGSHEGEDSQNTNRWLDECARQRSEAGTKALALARKLMECLKQCDTSVANQIKQSIACASILHPLSTEGSAFSKREEWSAFSRMEPHKPHKPKIDFNKPKIDLCEPKVWREPQRRKAPIKPRQPAKPKQKFIELSDSGVEFDKRVALVHLLKYTCEYCSTERESTSTGQDGRIRIRCECGGKHADGVPRMHAMWRLSSEVENESSFGIVKNTVKADTMRLVAKVKHQEAEGLILTHPTLVAAD